jgi:hypothetical protein
MVPTSWDIYIRSSTEGSSMTDLFVTLVTLRIQVAATILEARYLMD